MLRSTQMASIAVPSSGAEVTQIWSPQMTGLDHGEGVDRGPSGARAEGGQDEADAQQPCCPQVEAGEPAHLGPSSLPDKSNARGEGAGRAGLGSRGVRRRGARPRLESRHLPNNTMLIEVDLSVVEGLK